MFKATQKENLGQNFEILLKYLYFCFVFWGSFSFLCRCAFMTFNFGVFASATIHTYPDSAICLGLGEQTSSSRIFRHAWTSILSSCDDTSHSRAAQSYGHRIKIQLKYLGNLVLKKLKKYIGIALRSTVLGNNYFRFSGLLTKNLVTDCCQTNTSKRFQTQRNRTKYF